jgi:DNA-binding MarR family transcriptional regulator
MNEQPDLFSVDLTDLEQVLANTPGRHHKGGMSTEREAAERVSFRSGSQKARALIALARLGTAIPHQLQAEARCATASGATTRLEELEAIGLVERTTERRDTPYGSRAFVWRATARGVEVARQLAAKAAA